jgi:hypothetical protein
VNQNELNEEIVNLKNMMEEKQKIYKIEMNKKDQIIK